MSLSRQIAAVGAVALVAAVLGFAAMAWITGGGGSTPAVAAGPAPAPPAEALPPPTPPVAPPVTTGTPVAPQAPPPVEPDPAPAPDPAPPVVEAEPAPPVTEAPEPQPAPGEGTPAEPREPTRTRSTPAPATPAPSPPPASATAPPPAPPEGVRIPAGELPSGVDPAKRALVEALRSAAPGSTAEADIRRMLSLWAAYAGPDSAGTPPARRATIARALRANAWWFAGRDAPARRVLLVDPDGVILTYRAGQGFAVNPVATTGRWRDLNSDVPPQALAEALLPMGVPRTAAGRSFLVWEYYDVPGDPTAIRPGASGMAQARVALLMAHADNRTGDPRFADAAAGALTALTVDVDLGGVRSMVTTSAGQEPMPWYVERAYPGEDPWTGGALNGFMVTLLNLRGTGALLDRAPDPGPSRAAGAALARDLADRGSQTLVRHLPDHDTGTWSLYGLLTPGRPWKTYLADLNYHCYHVRLLTQLATPYPGLGFGTTADRWQRYVDDAGATCPPRAGDAD